MRGVFFYVAVIGLVLGIFARSLYEFGVESIAWILFLSFTAVVIWKRSTLVAREEISFENKSSWNQHSSLSFVLLCSIFMLCMSLGALRMEVANWKDGQSQFLSSVGKEVAFRGVVQREPDIRENATHLYVRVDTEIVLVTTDRFANIRYGDELFVTGKLMEPSSFETDLGRTFNYPGYLRARGVAYMMQYADIEKVSSGKGNRVVSALLSFKMRFMENIETVLQEPHAGLSEGLLLGVKRALGEDLETVFRKTGIIHIVVLSGYNIMLVVAFVMYVLAFLLPMRARLVFGIVAVSAFALMVGLSATVVRASIMAALVLVARSFGRTYTVMRALMLAGLVMLFINPYLPVYDTGFQLSFVATLGLILVAPVIEARLHLVPTVIGLREFLTATLATQLFVMPILLYQIGEFSVVSVVVNVLVLPMVPVAMLLTFAAGMLVFVSHTLALPIAFVAYGSLTYIISVATFFAALPFASFVVPTFPFVGVLVAYGVLGYGLYYFSHVKKDTKDTQTFSEWTIEEAADVEREKEKPLPVFFR